MWSASLYHEDVGRLQWRHAMVCVCLCVLCSHCTAGIGDPVYFYVQSVFAINGLLPAILFLLAVTMRYTPPPPHTHTHTHVYTHSGSVMSGCTCLLMFLYNHTEATRVMWTPPLRESFGIPLIYLQLLALSRNIRYLLYCLH